ncbi:MAG: hypothetical protein JWR01_1424 [Subtercola sp.]|nr:hypothetical protein [Subtercola sp.]
MSRVKRGTIAVAVGLVVLAVVALALVQRLHLYPGLARLWE